MENFNSNNYRDDLAKNLKNLRGEGKKVESEDLLKSEKEKPEYNIGDFCQKFHRENKKFNGKEYKENLNLEEILNKLYKNPEYTEQDATDEIIEQTNDINERINALRSIFGMRESLKTGIYGKTSPERKSYQYPSTVFNSHIDAHNMGYGETNYWYPGMAPSEREEKIEEEKITQEMAPFKAPDCYHWESDFMQGQYWALVNSNMSEEQRNHIIDLMYGNTGMEDNEVPPSTWSAEYQKNIDYRNINRNALNIKNEIEKTNRLTSLDKNHEKELVEFFERIGNFIEEDFKKQQKENKQMEEYGNYGGIISFYPQFNQKDIKDMRKMLGNRLHTYRYQKDSINESSAYMNEQGKVVSLSFGDESGNSNGTSDQYIGDMAESKLWRSPFVETKEAYLVEPSALSDLEINLPLPKGFTLYIDKNKLKIKNNLFEFKSDSDISIKGQINGQGKIDFSKKIEIIVPEIKELE